MSVKPRCSCQMRRKVQINGFTHVSFEDCGVPDSVIADFVKWDVMSPMGRPVLVFNFCPWCGDRWMNPDEQGSIQESPYPD